ncbi:MAG: GAF domain-containing protein [Deltaproteobacteria bacterium]|nr:GAF domain-containing protein [Deltaproteobacteria bacterium]
MATGDGNARARLLFDLGCSFAARLQIGELVPYVIAKCREVLDAEGASLLLLDAERNELYFPFVVDEDPAVAERLRSLRFPAERGIAGATLQSGEALRVDDVANDPRFFSAADRHSGFHSRNMLCAPLKARGGSLGVLQIVNRHRGGFNDDDLEFLEALAGSVAVAVENAQLYSRLQQAAAELEQKVVDRTQELQEKNSELGVALQRLRAMQAQLVTQEKLAALGQLTAGIAHEIKNPLNFVNNFAQLSGELMQDLQATLGEQAQRLEPQARDSVDETVADLAANLERIRQHGQRADAIVRSMLQHARSGGGEPAQPTDVNALLEENAALAYHGWRGREPGLEIAIDTSYDPAAGTVFAVPQDLGRVFLNIIGNACYAVAEKHRRLGGRFTPKLSLRTIAHPRHVEIRIRDNGDGIASAAMENIFTPFFTTKPAGEGTGLGLSISHDIVVQQHRGQLKIDSIEGEYAELIIELPRKEMVDEAR